MSPDEHIPATAAQSEEISLSTAGQRRINLIWEYTQAFIASIVVLGTFGVASILALRGKGEQLPTMFSMGFGMVVGFYFSRTNHAAIGGVGEKPTQKYVGR